MRNEKTILITTNVGENNAVKKLKKVLFCFRFIEIF